MWDLFLKGGPVMYLLLLCSIGGFYIVVLKALFLRQNKITPSFLTQIKHDLRQEGKQRAIQRLQSKSSFSSRTLQLAIQVSDQPEPAIESALSMLCQKTMVKIENGLNLLSSIVTVSPILGILGTVLGLMDIFNVISGGGLGQPDLLSAGIAEALISTVAGLSVAIPFIFLNQWLNRENELFMVDIEQSTAEIVNFCKSGEVQP